MWRLPVNNMYILLSRQRRLLGSINYWSFMEMCFVAIELLERAKRVSQCRMSRSMTITVQREGKRRTVACIEATSYSRVKIDLKLWGLTVT